jgi:hypothetical protein
VDQLVRGAGLGRERPLLVGQRDTDRGESDEDRDGREQCSAADPHHLRSSAIAHSPILSLW